MNQNVHPILYSFRRCPYAMRARMALFQSGKPYEHREIILRDKPAHMLEISPKGTVPVLLLPDGTVIDESLDIVSWSLSQNDPENWLLKGNKAEQREIQALISQNDNDFKPLLDRYKYPNRYPDENEDTLGEKARDKATTYLKTLEDRLSNNLFRDTPCKADITIFPFIRQFAHVDREWFDHQNLPKLQNWLSAHKESALFKTIMKKHDLWTQGAPKLLMNAKN